MAKQSSSYLDKVPPIVVKPLVAAAIGLSEAIVIQQINYWLQRSTNIREDRRWIYNTYGEWAEQFPFWSESTIGRIFRGLEDKGLVLSRQFNAGSYDHTKWYTIDYDALDKTLIRSGMFDDAKLTPSDDAKLTPSTLDRDYQKTTPPQGGGGFNIFSAYSTIMGLMVNSPYEQQKLQQIEEDFTEEWIEDAMKICVDNNKRKLSYLMGILNRWKTDGRESVPGGNGSGGIVFDEATGEFRA